jgi:hypothetical protein
MDAPIEMYVVPVPGGLVRMYPTREVMPATGAFVPEDVYWMRRILHGDVVRGTPPKQGQEAVVVQAPEQSEERFERKKSHKKIEVDK